MSNQTAERLFQATRVICGDQSNSAGVGLIFLELPYGSAKESREVNAFLSQRGYSLPQCCGDRSGFLRNSLTWQVLALDWVETAAGSSILKYKWFIAKTPEKAVVNILSHLIPTNKTPSSNYAKWFLIKSPTPTLETYRTKVTATLRKFFLKSSLKVSHRQCGLSQRQNVNAHPQGCPPLLKA